MLGQGTRRLAGSILHMNSCNLRRLFVTNQSRKVNKSIDARTVFYENVLDFFQKKLDNKYQDEKVNNGIKYSRNKMISASNETRKSKYQVVVKEQGEQHAVYEYKALAPTEVKFYNEILRVLNKITLNDLPNVVGTQYYKAALKLLRKGLLESELTVHEAIQYLFYLTLMKKQSTNQVEEVLKFLPDLKKLSLFEKCILAECCFKASKKLDEHHVKELEATLAKNSEYLVKNSRLLVCLAKIIRYSGPTKDLNLNDLSTHIMYGEYALSMSTTSHILQLYAEAFMDNTKVIECLISKAIENIKIYNTLSQKKNDFEPDFILQMQKVKYLSNILWATSRLNHHVHLDHFKEISMYIDKLFHILLVHNQQLTNIFLHLWLLDYRLEEKIKECLERDVFYSILYNSTWKGRMRLQLLLTCVRIEAKHIVIPNKLIQKNKVNIPVSDNVRIVNKVVQMLSIQLKLSNVCIECPVSGILINGISFEHRTKGKVHIDILDEETRLKCSLKPFGILNLKLRLLPKVGYYSILIDDQYILNPVSTFIYVKNMINKFLHEES